MGYHHAINVANTDARTSPEALTYDTLRAVKSLGFDAQLLRVLLDTDDAVVTRLLDEGQMLAPDSEEGERALLLIRLHRALGDVYGSLDQVHSWLDTTSRELGGRPRDIIRAPGGLGRVVVYMESQCKDCLW